MMNIKVFTFNPFMENTYVLWDNTKECIIVDPGCYEKYEQDELKGFIESEGLIVKLLLNTHCHIDHVVGNSWVKNTYNVPLGIHQKDVDTLRSVSVYAPVYGFNLYEGAEADFFLEDGQEVVFGNTTLKVLFVPGHAPGHIAFYNVGMQAIIGGDVLFRKSIGRTDLPGGNFDTLIESIMSKFFNLDDEVVVYPGHGPATTIGEEKESNPFCGVNTNSWK